MNPVPGPPHPLVPAPVVPAPVVPGPPLLDPEVPEVPDWTITPISITPREKVGASTLEPETVELRATPAPVKISTFPPGGSWPAGRVMVTWARVANSVPAGPSAHADPIPPGGCRERAGGCRGNCNSGGTRERSGRNHQDHGSIGGGHGSTRLADGLTGLVDRGEAPHQVQDQSHVGQGCEAMSGSHGHRILEDLTLPLGSVRKQ